MNRSVFWVVIVLMLGGLLFVFTFNAPDTPPLTAVQSQEKTFTLVVQNRTLVSGPSTLIVKQGDQVTINITVDEDEELHVHGYDISVDLEKGKQGSLTFTASASGRFPFELEHSKTELGALEVQP
ncbi:MAG: cupredoxin domain-containing protein [bacterium]|nr:cupredoxin domain-containing protein [bacterium]